MRTPNIEKIKVGDYYVYTTEFKKIIDLDDNKLIDDLWSDKYLGSNRDENGDIEDQGPGVHFSLDVDDLPYFAHDPYYFALTFARSLRSLEGKSLDLINSGLWIIAAQDEHTPYWHTHRKNITDPRLNDDDIQVDSTYSFSFYLNTLECGSPFSDLLFAHKEDVFSMPVTKGKLCFFDGDVFHKPKLVPKEFGWRYCIAGDLLFNED
tara:strand:- start:1625 stop:2245 length:621 start_codon:yes stop_codon:yes gene_type:complete